MPIMPLAIETVLTLQRTSSPKSLQLRRKPQKHSTILVWFTRILIILWLTLQSPSKKETAETFHYLSLVHKNIRLTFQSPSKKETAEGFHYLSLVHNIVIISAGIPESLQEGGNSRNIPCILVQFIKSYQQNIYSRDILLSLGHTFSISRYQIYIPKCLQYKEETFQCREETSETSSYNCILPHTSTYTQAKSCNYHHRIHKVQEKARVYHFTPWVPIIIYQNKNLQ